jgi:VWFA-related protein
MRTRDSFTTALLVAILAAPALAAQTAPPPQSSFGESIDVRVVNVEAVITDRKGNRVPGLTPADFRLLVDGREVPVDYFTEIKGGEVAASASSPKEGALAAVAPAGPGEKVGINYLVYIDNQFSVPARRNIVLRRLAADLGRLGPEDRMTLIAFDGLKLRRLNDWTGDRQALARAFAQAEESPSFGILMMAQRESDNYNTGQCLLNPKSVAAAMEMGTGMRLGIRAMVGAMRGTLAPPGRKVLVFLNGGWGLPDSATDESGLPSAIGLPEAEKVFAPVYDTANLLGYTLYPIEVHGMMFSGSLWNEARIPFPMDHDFILSGFERSVQYDLEVMARETGGKALLNSARLDAFARVAADTSSYYWLGFAPEWRADDRRHDIRVEVRRPGLSVRSRSGFSDLSQETQAQAQAESLLLFGGSGADESLVVTAGALRQVSRRLRELPVTVEIPADALVPQPAEGGWVLTGWLSVGLLEKSSESPHWKTLPVRLTMSKLPPAGGRAQWQTALKFPKSASKLIFALGGENGKVSAWTQLDLQQLAQERTAALTKGGK